MKLTRIEQVLKRVGRTPGPRDLKVIDHVDAHARRWLSYSRFGFVAFGGPERIELTAAGGEKGFVSAPDPGHLLLPLATLDDRGLVEDAGSFGSLFLVGGMEETLRINGKVSRIDEGVATLTVEECYLHCAKSFRRSDFWKPEASERSIGDKSDFVEQARFLVLSSMNGRGQADVSPKGDPEGFLLREEDGVIDFADRPGNRRVDSFRNIIERPEVSLLALIPGCQEILAIRGRAELCADEPLLERFAIQGRKPGLLTRIQPETTTLEPSRAIARSALWSVDSAPEDLVPAEIFKAHMKQSKETSLQAKVARAAISLPGALEKGLDWDYKNNLY